VHENVVHALDDAVAIHPEVLPVAVVPIPVDPDRPGTLRDGLLDHDGLWRRWRLFGSRDRFGFLHYDHGLAIDLLGLAFLGLNDHVGGEIRRLARLTFSSVAIV
jgi:hypothetical protein